MLCYKDRWFCPFYKTCDYATKCDRPLTEDVYAKAQSLGLYIQQVADKPSCHSENKKGD